MFEDFTSACPKQFGLLYNFFSIGFTYENFVILITSFVVRQWLNNLRIFSLCTENADKNIVDGIWYIAPLKINIILKRIVAKGSFVDLCCDAHIVGTSLLINIPVTRNISTKDSALHILISGCS